MTEGKKTWSKTPRRHYLVFWMIVVILLAFLKSCSDWLKTNDEKIAEYKAEIAQIEEQKQDAVSQEYLNAKKKAEIYCWMFMSQEWIKQQLTSSAWEWFSEDSAQYAIENLDCDYKANALEKGKFYFTEMNISKERVLEQLSSPVGEKFTEEEAQYAIDNLE